MKRKKGGACSQAASGVMHTPPRARTRVVCPSCSHTEILKESLCSRTTGARTRVREGGKAPIRDRGAYFKAWRAAKFGGDFDAAMLSLDAHMASFDDPSKIAAFSDDGSGAAAIRDGGADAPADAIEAALGRLPERDRAFARAVLDGKRWREMGIGKMG